MGKPNTVKPLTVHADWWVVNDTVMGGRSSSSWQLSEGGVGVFQGSVSLENNGGFASVRGTTPEDAFGNHSHLKVEVKGDGRTYRLCVRSRQVQSSVSYQQGFKTNGEWQTIIFPVSDLLPRWRGRQLDGLPPLLGKDITGVGFIIADKRSGPFILNVRSIEGVTPLK